MNLIEKYILKPIELGLPYNPVTTSLNIVLLILFGYLTYKILKKWNVNLDFEFIILTFPYVLFGTFSRVLVDVGYLPRNIFTVTPGIWIETWIIALVLLFFLRRGIINEKIYSGIGILLSAFPFYLIVKSLNSFSYFFIFLPFFSGSLYFYYILLKMSNLDKKEFIFPGLAHILDSVSSSLSIHLKGYFEEHIVTSFIVYSHPEIYVLIKIFLPFLLIYLIRDFDEFDRNFLIFLIYLIGIGPGIRNLILLLL